MHCAEDSPARGTGGSSAASSDFASVYWISGTKVPRTSFTNKKTHMNRDTLTTAAGAPIADNQNSQTAGPRGPMLLQDVWFLEKLAHFDREVIPERRVHAKGSGAYGRFRVTLDTTKYTKASCGCRSNTSPKPIRPMEKE